MSTTPNLTQPVGRVRLLIGDTDSQIFDDDEITALLELCGDSILRAAAQALDIIATSEVLISKKIRTQDLTTDGPAVAAELRKQADTLRAQADTEEAADAVVSEIVEAPYGIPYQPGPVWPRW